MSSSPEEIEKEIEKYSPEEIEKYDWNTPIDDNPELAHDALSLCHSRIFNTRLNLGWPPKMPICVCKTCKRPPAYTWNNVDGEKQVGLKCMEHGGVISRKGDGSTLADLVTEWNKMQESGDDAETVTVAPNGPKSLDELLEQKPDDGEPLTKSQKLIAEVCDAVKSLLLEKNRKYGDSALNPCRIFAKSDSVEQIKVRIDDKLNRIRNEQGDEDEDVVQDLIGYLVLLRCARKMKQEASR